MIRLWNCTDALKDMLSKCEELPQFKFLDQEEMDILLCYNEIMLILIQKNIELLNKELQ